MFDKKLYAGGVVFLRPIERADVSETYVGWLNDSRVNQYLETRFRVQDLASVRDFVEAKRAADDEYLMAICLAESGRHIGNIKIGPINPWHLRADLSLFIGDRDCWGKGVATAAIHLMVEEAFSGTELHKLCAGVYEGNTGSLSAFKRNGFEQEGLLRQHFQLNGRWLDGLLLGLTRDAYAQRCCGSE